VSNDMDLECSSVVSEEQLKHIFKADFPLKNFREIRIVDNNTLKVLEASVFHGISFEIIYIIHNNLEVIESQALNSCYENATEIVVSYNKITSFSFDELSQYPKLSHFGISSNSLNVIPADAFHGLTALEHLYISDNNADIVGSFQELPNLHDIRLDHNNITIIPSQFIKMAALISVTLLCLTIT
ncbi:unnamed protein product, partial [Meganyctiphanes norvegica]